MRPILTIMIPTTFDRRPLFKELVLELSRQIIDNKCEDVVDIIYEEDAKEISVGAKRQILLERSIGHFVVGFDSDDWPAPTYIKDIVSTLRTYPEIDHVGFFEHCTIDGEISTSIFSIKHKVWAENSFGYDHIRCANPKSVIRRSKAIQIGYEDLRYGEDRIFSEKVTPLLNSEFLILKVLYYYRHTSTPHEERYGITQ